MTASDNGGFDRSRFPLVESTVYLDSASKGALGVHVRAAVDGFLDQWDRRGACWDEWLGTLERVQELYAQLLSTQRHWIFPSGSVSAAIGALVTALDYTERPGLVVVDRDFPTLIDIGIAARRLGARIDMVDPIGTQGGILDAVAAVVRKDTAAVVIGAVHHAAAFEAPLDLLGELCRERGAVLLVDGYHQAGVADVRVESAGVDAFASGCMKYLLGAPGGLTLTYCGARLLERVRPLSVGWLGSADPFSVAREPVPRQQGAAMFTAGLSSLMCAAAAEAGLRTVLSWGTARVASHVRDLVLQAADGLEQAGIPYRAAGSLLCIPATVPALAVRDLACAGVTAGSWGDHVRLSFHGYNNVSDVDALLSALRDPRLRAVLGGSREQRPMGS